MAGPKLGSLGHLLLGVGKPTLEGLEDNLDECGHDGGPRSGPAVDVDEADLAESLELPGADLSCEVLTVRALPRQADEFRQGLFGLGATTIPFREINPSSSRDPKTWANPQASPRLCRLARNSATRITA